MKDESDRSQEVDKARQLAELISWIFYDDRRLGLLDRCERLEGHVSDGKAASLAGQGGGWELQVENSPARVLGGFEDVLRTITSTHFTPERVVVIPRFAGLLFQAAVEQTQAGLANYLQYLSAKHKAREEKSGNLDGPEFFAMVLGIPIGGPIEAALGMSSLDESLRHSIAGITLAVSAAEAQINEWVNAKGGWIEDEDRETLVRKMKLLAAKADRELDVGRAPFQRLHECVGFRNDLVHPKHKEKELAASERSCAGAGPIPSRPRNVLLSQGVTNSTGRFARSRPARILGLLPSRRLPR